MPLTMAAYTYGVCLHPKLPFKGSILPVCVSLQSGSGRLLTYMEVRRRLSEVKREVKMEAEEEEEALEEHEMVIRVENATAAGHSSRLPHHTHRLVTCCLALVTGLV